MAKRTVNSYLFCGWWSFLSSCLFLRLHISLYKKDRKALMPGAVLPVLLVCGRVIMIEGSDLQSQIFAANSRDLFVCLHSLARR